VEAAAAAMTVVEIVVATVLVLAITELLIEEDDITRGTDGVGSSNDVPNVVVVEDDDNDGHDALGRRISMVHASQYDTNDNNVTIIIIIIIIIAAKLYLFETRIQPRDQCLVSLVFIRVSCSSS
jgi:hypothetical protein